VPCYPYIILADFLFSHLPQRYTECNSENCDRFRKFFGLFMQAVALLGHLFVMRYLNNSWFSHFCMFWGMEAPNWVIVWALGVLSRVFKVNRNEHDIAIGKPGDGKLGKTICIVGNGPSVRTGPALGHLIDAHDEVVRFNNFHCGESVKAWSGSKTTFHFSDAMLFPTYPEYQVEGARFVLPIFLDRLSYSTVTVLLRSGVDLEPGLCEDFLMNDDVWPIAKADLTRMRSELNLASNRTPTSGYIAIDLFSKIYDKVTICGFDFFQGKDIHYYEKEEPWYERFNNRLGVQFHSPGKEKLAIIELIKQGKVEFLKGSKITTEEAFADECAEERGVKKKDK